MFCQNCGAQIADNAKFCSGCGTPLNAAPVLAQPQMGGAGYSPVANTPEFLQFAAKKKRKLPNIKESRVILNNWPSAEMVADKYEEFKEYHADIGFTFVYYDVIFKDAAGHPLSFRGTDKRHWEYYQIGDRCLYHGDIHFFEKYDKSRDTFSLCPFCLKKVELGQMRCTHCNKPLLV